MRKRVVAIVALAALAVTACQKPEEGVARAGQHKGGRYVAVGIYFAGSMWKHLVRDVAVAKDLAQFDDDEQVIVVMDSVTGEVRQCGALTGHCISLDPWRTALPPTQRAPVALSKHASDLEQSVSIEVK